MKIQNDITCVYLQSLLEGSRVSWQQRQQTQDVEDVTVSSLDFVCCSCNTDEISAQITPVWHRWVTNQLERSLQDRDQVNVWNEEYKFNMWLITQLCFCLWQLMKPWPFILVYYGPVPLLLIRSIISFLLTSHTRVLDNTHLLSIYHRNTPGLTQGTVFLWI